MANLCLLNKILLFVALLLYAGTSFAQQKTIQGKVTDARDGAALPGVTIRIKEASDIGTVSRMDGSFSLQAPANAKTLVVSYVGYTAKEVPITGSTVNVQLSSGKNLEEIVVIGYGTQKAKDVSAAVASISAKDFNSGVVTNPMQQIQGKVSG